MTNWIYKGTEITDISQFATNAFGFIYIIRQILPDGERGAFYVGKKQLQSRTNVKLGKKELLAAPITRGRTKTKKLVVKESKWQDYLGSNKEFQTLYKEIGAENFVKEILHISSNSKQLTYHELKQIILTGALEDKLSFNDNLLGKIFSKDLVDKESLLVL